MPNGAKSEKVLKKMMCNPLSFKKYFLSLHPLNRTRGRREPEVKGFCMRVKQTNYRLKVKTKCLLFNS